MRPKTRQDSLKQWGQKCLGKTPLETTWLSHPTWYWNWEKILKIQLLCIPQPFAWGGLWKIWEARKVESGAVGLAAGWGHLSVERSSWWRKKHWTGQIIWLRFLISFAGWHHHVFLGCAIFNKVNISLWCSIELDWLLEIWQSDKSSWKGEKEAKI